MGIFLNDIDDFSLAGYCDSNWAGCIKSRRSVMGLFLLFGGSPISWKSKNQPTIALSSAEAEYRALRKIIAEVAWLVRLFVDFGISNLTLVQVFCDN